MTIVRRIALAALILLAAGAFAQENQITETVLPNGLKVLIKEVHSAPVFTCQVWYNVGSRNEHPGITGVSHMVEHMMFKGTKEHGKGVYSRMIKSKGGMSNASTYLDWTNYWELLSSDHLEMAIKLEADRMQNALIDEKEFEAERVVIISEMEGRENDPGTLFYQNMQAIAYLQHPYRWPVIGYRDDLENITRGQVYQYYRTYYHPNNAVLVIVGDVDTEKTLELVRKYFGKIPKGPEPPKVNITEPPQQGERRFILRREGTAERVMIAYHIPDISHPDTYPLMLLDQIMSGGKSTRLYQSMVETQMATSAYASSGIRKDPGLFMLAATGRNGVTAAELEKALLDEIEKAKTTLPTEEELAQAKRQYETYLIYQNDSVSDQGELLGFYEATASSWRYLETLLPRINAVTAEDVQRVAKKYLTEENRTVGWFIPASQTAGEPAPAGQPEESLNLKPKQPIIVNYQTVEDVKPVITSPAVAAPDASTVKANPTKIVKPQRIMLKNGITLIVQENHSNPTVAIRGTIKAGGYFDPVGKKGLSKFVAAMLSRGTTNWTALELAAKTDRIAADISISSDLEAVRFSGKSLSRDLESLLEVLSDELKNPSFPADQVEKLKGQMLTALEMEKEDPDARAVREFNRIIFPEDHPARPQTIEEDQESIKQIEVEDLISFHKQYYTPDATVIVIVGDVTLEKAVKLAEMFFGDWKPSGDKRKIEIPRVSLAKNNSKNVIEMMDKSQVSVIFGHAGQLRRSDPDFYAVNVMNNILGGGAGLESRLGNKIRDEMGLVYYIFSVFDAGLGDGPFIGGFGANPANADKALSAAEQVIRDFIKNGPTKAEFDEAIDYITGSFPIRLETNDGVANILSAAEFYGLGMDYIERYSSIYRSVTMDQVKKAAEKYLHPDYLTTVIAGPYKKID